MVMLVTVLSYVSRVMGATFVHLFCILEQLSSMIINAVGTFDLYYGKDMTVGIRERFLDFLGSCVDFLFLGVPRILNLID